MSPRALVYNPDLNTLGGGERVMLAVAEVLEQTHEVTIGGPSMPTPAEFHRRGLRSNFPAVCFAERDLWRHSRNADLLVYFNNHLPFPSLARRNLLFVQFPFPSSRMRRMVGAAAIRQYDCVVYSEYVRGHLRREWRRDGAVLTPPVRLGRHDPGAKENIILAVGRFFPSGHTKRQDILVEGYRRLPEAVRRRWRLVLAGGVSSDAAAQAYLEEIRQSAAGLNIEVRADVSQEDLNDLFRRAGLFWHATGYGRSASEPGKAEHFGISTVEAMSWGAVPIAYADGGSAEIVDQASGRLWRSIDDLVASTIDLAGDPHRREALARSAVRKSVAFDEGSYGSRVQALLRRCLDG